MQIDIKDIEVLGHFFEVAIKRGILHYLIANEYIAATNPNLARWHAHRISKLIFFLQKALNITDPNQEAIVNAYAAHILISGYGLGWTTIREWLKQTQHSIGILSHKTKSKLILERLWCPLSWPSEICENDSVGTFWQAMDIQGPRNENWRRTGEPVNADFLALFSLQHAKSRSESVGTPANNLLLCLEFSKNVAPKIPDFRESDAHLEELLAYHRRIESRSIFSKINAEVSEGQFVLNNDIISRISYFTGKDKPLYKLCQGASYATNFIRRMRENHQPVEPVLATVLAVTPDGIEGMTAKFIGTTPEPDPRVKLMQELGRGYVKQKVHNQSEPDRAAQLTSLLKRLERSLPQSIRSALPKNIANLNLDAPLIIKSSEQITGYVNPADKHSRAEVLGWLPESTPELTAWFGGSLHQSITDTLVASDLTDKLSLRDLHGAAIHAAIHSIPKDELRVLGLEGNPGIGKTHALISAVKTIKDGVLFLYLSPRVVINNEVISKFVDDVDTVAMSCNDIINRGASTWLRQQAIVADAAHATPAHRIDGGVIWTPRPHLKRPQTNIAYLDQAAADAIDEKYSTTGNKRHQITEHTTLIETVPQEGVMRTLGRAARDLLEINPTLRRLVLTASIQGYKETQTAQNTLKGFAKSLFRHNPDENRGLNERQIFAQNISTIIIMVDEIAGDGAGAPLVHELYQLLNDQFFRCFRGIGHPSPFRLILVLADASLANEQVLASYLRDTKDAPEKVLISTGRPKSPFAIKIHPVPLANRSIPALHIMADSFPANSLQIEYQVNLKNIKLAPKVNTGQLESPHEAILRFAKEHIEGSKLVTAINLIFRHLPEIPANQQMLLFVQDKYFLRQLRNALLDDDKLNRLGIQIQRPSDLTAKTIAKLDSSVSAKLRRELMDPATRDTKRLILMTASGSRGISFPQATTIVAWVPRFAIEGGLMEIAQLIYRGRGGTGGDNYPRRLIMIIDDFSFIEPGAILEPEFFIRRKLDILSLLILLRATILTRIQGNSGLKQPLAVVPVGRIGLEIQARSFSDTIATFLQEARLYQGDSVGHNKDVIIAAESGVRALLTNQSWDINFYKQRGQDLLFLHKPHVLQNFIQDSTRPAALILDPTIPAKLPDYIFCSGPLWLENIEDINPSLSSEQLEFPLWNSYKQIINSALGKQLRYIANPESKFPALLQQTADKLCDILWLPVDAGDKQVYTKRHIASRKIWCIFPVDYIRFLSVIINPLTNEVRFQLETGDAESWLQVLRNVARLYRNPTVTHPVLPVFKDIPFLAMLINGVPHNFHSVLNNRLFMASNEFNLLNTLLLPGVESSLPPDTPYCN
ncbi:hypothetical protein TI04_00625 [Achromatium sp. WMS2]|nr:hypothetical protein TI04_00625 [Achromatium sp. WMS2]